MFKTPFMAAPDDGGGESLDDEGQEKDVDSQDGEGDAGEDNDSETNQKPPKQDRDTNEQFKAARVAAEQQSRAMRERQDAFAKKFGWNSFEELEQAERQREAEAERKAYQAKGIDPDAINELISNHPVVKQAQELTARSKITTEKSAIADKPFFKELEPEIDKILQVNPSLPVSAVYNYVRGEKLDEMIHKSSSDATKRTIADIFDKKKRGLTDAGDSSDGAVDLTPEGKRMTEAFGNDPKEIAKYVKKKRS